MSFLFSFIFTALETLFIYFPFIFLFLFMCISSWEVGCGLVISKSLFLGSSPPCHPRRRPPCLWSAPSGSHGARVPLWMSASLAAGPEARTEALPLRSDRSLKAESLLRSDLLESLEAPP